MIYIIGYMGAGKSIVGKKLAEALKIKFLDTDKEIEYRQKKSIRQIFREKGENYFRELEKNILRRIRKPQIISCGGGLPIYNNNMCYINNTGRSIYLKASSNLLYNRLKNDYSSTRPLLNNISKNNLERFIKKQLLEREAIYNTATNIIDIENKTTKMILREINSFILPL